MGGAACGLAGELCLGENASKSRGAVGRAADLGLILVKWSWFPSSLIVRPCEKWGRRGGSRTCPSFQRLWSGPGGGGPGHAQTRLRRAGSERNGIGRPSSGRAFGTAPGVRTLRAPPGRRERKVSFGTAGARDQMVSEAAALRVRKGGTPPLAAWSGGSGTARRARASDCLWKKRAVAGGFGGARERGLALCPPRKRA